MIANARMYAVTPAAEAAWATLFRTVAGRAGVALTVLAHPFPLPVSDLWARPDLGCAFMCGWPLVRGVADVVPVAAPVPRGAPGPVYWSDLVVAEASPAQTLAETAGATAAYTLRDSQSGFNAFRHHLRTQGGPRYAAEAGPLTTPRRVIEAVAAGRAGIGPVDSYAHALLRLHDPALTRQVRTIAQTRPTPIPLLVASRGAPQDEILRLRAALLALTDADILAPLALTGFAAPPPQAAYAGMERDAQDAAAAGLHSLLLP